MKKYLIGLFAIVLAVAFTAFTHAPVKTFNSVYHFIGTTYNDANYNVESNWELGDVSCGTPDQLLCKITAPDGASSLPDFSGLPVGGNVRTDATIISNQTFKQ